VPSSFTIQLAKTAEEFKSALCLLQESRTRWGLEKQGADELWLTKHHALPSTNTIIALYENKVVGAICLFGECPFHLPLETHLDLKLFRKNFEGRLSEISIPGISSDFTERPDLLLALYHFAVCFGCTNCNYDGFVMEAPLAWAKEHADTLHYQRIFEPLNGQQLLFFNSRADALDFRSHICAELKVDYHFPEKKFFLVSHHSMQPAVLNYLFNECTHLFASLSDSDLRVLKNVYDWGDYAKLMPDRPMDLPQKKTPRFPRFPMNCEGFIVTSKGSQEHVHLLDVSREGLKVRYSVLPEIGACSVFTLFVGVNKKTEVIARAVWIDEKTEIAGFEIRSSDVPWAQLIEYLEKDFLRIA
jgi:hypothetical protein